MQGTRLSETLKQIGRSGTEVYFPEGVDVCLLGKNVSPAKGFYHGGDEMRNILVSMARVASCYDINTWFVPG